MSRLRLHSRPHARLLLLFWVFALASPATPAWGNPVHRGPKKEVKEQILDLEQQWRTATLTADSGMMEGLLSDDYVGISWSGQVNTKATQIDRLRKRSLVITRMDLFETKVKVVNSVAIVTCRAQIEGTSDGSVLKGDFRYTRIYQRQPTGVWKITNFESTRVPQNRHFGGKSLSSGEVPPSSP